MKAARLRVCATLLKGRQPSSKDFFIKGLLTSVTLTHPRSSSRTPEDRPAKQESASPTPQKDGKMERHRGGGEQNPDLALVFRHLTARKC